MQETLIVRVPHQGAVNVWIAETEAQLRELAESSVGDNYEWPGHFARPEDEDDPGEWIDETTIEDVKRALAHDVHVTYFVTKEDLLNGWKPTCDHKSIGARIAVEATALRIGWIYDVNNYVRK